MPENDYTCKRCDAKHLYHPGALTIGAPGDGEPGDGQDEETDRG